MGLKPRIPWTRLTPPLPDGSPPARIFVEHAKQLSLMGRKEETPSDRDIEALRKEFLHKASSCPRDERPLLLAAGLVLTDLAYQRWRIRVRKGDVAVQPPAVVGADILTEKQRVRRQELVKRDAQLRQPAVSKFIRSMERRRLYQGQFVSIFSLMRDGRELAGKLRALRGQVKNGALASLDDVSEPYLQFVSGEERCSFTGLRLMDIWRYFRHTWTNQYTSVPGRSMLFLVRDRAAVRHPVMGIGALCSPIVQIRERDVWIGWHPTAFLEQARSNPTTSLAEWLQRVLNTAIDELYVDDFVEDELISPQSLRTPNLETVQRLLEEGAVQRKLHHRYVRSQDHKSGDGAKRRSAGYWVDRARTHLFRSKRAIALAGFLRARMVLSAHFKRRPSAERLAVLLRSSEGVLVVRKLLKKAKADRVGIAMADISVCGAVPPYNALLGGKLVSMLATSPEVVLEYQRRYAKVESEIASSMAGRAIVRPADLVLLGTTSLYGIGSSQYNRVKIPCEVLGGPSEEHIQYKRLGRSESFGTSHYSEETVSALVTIVQQTQEGQRVNSIFGEGQSPKLRKVRAGLDLLNFPSELLLRHGRHRIVYGISLVRNRCEYLLGMDAEPDYLAPMAKGMESSDKIAAWWRARWLRGRVQSDEVLAEVERHSLVWPIRHGARVPTPPEDKAQVSMFPDLM